MRRHARRSSQCEHNVARCDLFLRRRIKRCIKKKRIVCLHLRLGENNIFAVKIAAVFVVDAIFIFVYFEEEKNKQKTKVFF